MRTRYFLLLIPILTIAQTEDPLEYFPHKTGDMWEYFWYDLEFPDTLQNFNISDSVDAEGYIYVTQSARFINPIQPPALLGDSVVYKIDKSYNVFCLTCPLQEQFLYKLDAKRGDQWVSWIYQDSTIVYGYEMVRVMEVEEYELFGTNVLVKSYGYYFTHDSTDTTGLSRLGISLAKGLGLWSKGGGDAVGQIYLRGCVINDTLYGDTTDVITSLNISPEYVPIGFELYQNYPNPFNPSTTIYFKLPSANYISLVVYDAMGNEIKRLIDNEWTISGSHKIIWDGKSNSGLNVASGVYYYSLISHGTRVARSMILLK